MTAVDDRPQRRVRARRGEGERLREDVLRAAEELLVEGGQAAEGADPVAVLTLRGVAERVGVTTPSVYRHFADKAALVDAVCLRVWDELGRRMDDAASGAPDAFAALRRRGVAYVRFGLEHPVQYRLLLLQPTPGRGAALAASAAYRHVVEAVADCVAEGWFAGDAEELAAGVWASVHGLVALAVAHPRFPWPADLDALVQRTVAVAGLGTAVSSRVPLPDGDAAADDADAGVPVDRAATVQPALDALATALTRRSPARSRTRRPR